MSRRPSDKLRRDCESSQTCDNACNYIVFGGEISALSFARRLTRNGVRRPITTLTQGANRTGNEGILNTNYIVANVKNALQNLQPLTVQYVNSNDVSDFEDLSGSDNNPLDLTDTRTLTYYLPTGVIGGTLGQYMFQRAGRWEYGVSGQSLTRILQFIREYATPVGFNAAEAKWASRLSSVMGLQLVSSPVGRTPGILDHNEVFLKQIGSSVNNIDGFDSFDADDTDNGMSGRLIREIGLDLYRRVTSSGTEVRSSVRNIQFTRGSSSGLFNVTVDNHTTYPDSKIAFKINPLLKLRIAAIGGLGLITESIPSEYRISIPFPINSSGFKNSDFVNKLMYTYGGNSWMNSNNWNDDDECGGGCNSSSGRGPCGCHKGDKNRRCQCGNSGNSGPSGVEGIDFSQITPGADLIYAYLGFSAGNPFSCNRPANNNSNQAAWNLQAYVTSDDLYSTNPSGSFTQDGYLFLILDGQHLAHKRSVTYDPEGDEINVIFNNNAVECDSALQFATIASDVIYSLTGTRIPPKVLLRVRTTCTANGDCEAESRITNTPYRQNSMAFLHDILTVLYGASSSTTVI